jgi:hypothetical protein
MDKKEVIRYLGEASYWIEEVAGKSEAEEPHIKKMLEAIDMAITFIGEEQK